MNKKLDCIALHEAGHAVAHYLTDIPFKYVTIREDKEKNEHGERSLGHITFEKPLSKEEWDQHSMLDPKEFDRFFKDDFTKLAGPVAEMIYRGRFNLKSAKEDIRQWVGTSLNKLPEKLSSKYQSYILEYTFQILQTKTNWSSITSVALALIDEETLSYDQVCDVIEKNMNNPLHQLFIRFLE